MSTSPTEMLRALMTEAARRHDFRARGPFEGHRQYLEALIAHVKGRDFAAAHELRLGRRQADWTAEDVTAFRTFLFEDHRTPREHLAPGTAFPVIVDGPHPVTDASLDQLAGSALDAYMELKREKGNDTPPIFASVLLTDGRLLHTQVGRGDRVAVLKTMARELPVFGFFLAADTFIHAVPAEGYTGPTEKREALIMHVGTRDRRVMMVRPYRIVGGRVTFEVPPPPDYDKRGEGCLQDPYAVVFAQAPQTVRPQ